MQEENNSVDIQQEAKEIIKKELEKKGVINYMRAKVKKSIIDIISHQKESLKQKLDFDFMTPLHRLNKPKEIVLVCQLIKEFLKFYELEYTLPIFENESNIKENIKRETLLKELKLDDKKEGTKPVLLLLLQDKLNRKDDTLNAQTNKNIDRYDYNKSEGELSYSDSNKNQLNPAAFGSTNKSLDMTEPVNTNKFNTFNMQEIYKPENKSSNGSLIDEEDDKNKDNKSKENSENSKNEKVSSDFSNKEKESDENSNNKEDEKIEEKNVENKIKGKNLKNMEILNKYNDEFQDAIIEEITGREMKDKHESKNVESMSSQAYESTASNK